MERKEVAFVLSKLPNKISESKDMPESLFDTPFKEASLSEYALSKIRESRLIENNLFSKWSF